MLNHQKITTDLLIIGGGINGVGIAADAAGRGLSVVLCEKNDLANGTSMYSTKLIHGGLRYLEQYKFKLVREALREREVLLKKAPFLVRPLEFVLPHDQHLRPVWMVQIGLFLYDHLAKRSTLAKSKRLDLTKVIEGDALQSKYQVGFRYSDCQTDDSRLVVLNAIAAQETGATILTRHLCQTAYRENDLWNATLIDQSDQTPITIEAKALINATGPWVDTTLKDVLHEPSNMEVKLVQGSHIIVPRLYSRNHAYILQNIDKRIVFAIPYHHDFTLIGTTEIPFHGDPNTAQINQQEIEYLCEAINRYFKKPITPEDCISNYSGVRALYGNQGKSATATTREYYFELTDQQGHAPQLSIFGGKITTFRTLAEHALEKLRPWFPKMKPSWTANSLLPGGALRGLSVAEYFKVVAKKYSWLPAEILQRYVEYYGDRCENLLQGCHKLLDLGRHFGSGLYEREINFLIEEEWAQTAEDILWRRTHLGLYLTAAEIQSLEHYLHQ